MRIRKRWAARLGAAVLALTLSFGSALAVDALVPVGRAAGIKLHADGVMIASVDPVTTSVGQVSPAKNAGLQAGDIILTVNEKPVNTNDGLQEQVAASEGQPISLQVRRNNETIACKITPVQDTTGKYRLGVMIRDGMAGIGTITYVDPDTGTYGSLGHGICDGESGVLVPLADGSLMEASVANVHRGQAGEPGALQGEFNLQEDMGTVEKNTDTGIFGVLTDDRYYKNCQKMPLAKADEIKTGACEIWSNVEGKTVQHYQAEITKVGREDGVMMLHVTDPVLLEKTGGIVQGMSGSPIIQNGKLVGAVTHVLVNDPTRGYGILIENMLEAAK
ncbi:MAG: SpoIVB peptidase [Butyricicoccus pullicaecorum]|nr:SpoIVB peptidase [Butyricicoccus pullicaecorum]